MTACVVGVLAALVPGLGVGDASADSTAVPGSLSTVWQGTGPLTLRVPPGTTPSAVTGVLTMPQIVEGAVVSLLVNGRVGAQLPSTLYAKVVIPVTTADVLADGTLTVSLRYDAPLGTSTCEPPPEVALRKLGLDYTGVETPPTSVAAFFPPQAARIDVKVAPDAGDDVLQAALNAVAGISARYPAETPVVLSTSDQPLATLGAGQRVVSLVDSPQEVTTAVTGDFGVPTLVLSGSGPPLSAAARALGADVLSLAGSSDAADLSSRPLDADESPTRTLAALRSVRDPISTASDSFAAVLRPASFGGPVSSLALHLEGTHSAIPPGAEARLDVYLDDSLVGSRTLGEDAGVDVEMDVPGRLLRSSATLRVVARSAPASTVPTDPSLVAPGTCAPGLPLELTVDTERSTATATAGLGDLDGFQLLPQALAGRVPVALRQSDATRIDGAIDAAALISGLQRQARDPLEVVIVDPDVFLDEGQSGIIVGADDADSTALGAPLRLSGDRVLRTDDAVFEVGSDSPFAALETVVRTDGIVLMLGSWAPGDTLAAPSLSHRITDTVTDDGWGSLEGDLMILDGGPPYTVDSGRPAVVVDDEPGQEESSYLRYFLLAIAVLLALLAVQLVRALLRDRRN